MVGSPVVLSRAPSASLGALSAEQQLAVQTALICCQAMEQPREAVGKYLTNNAGLHNIGSFDFLNGSQTCAAFVTDNHIPVYKPAGATDGIQRQPTCFVIFDALCGKADGVSCLTVPLERANGEEGSTQQAVSEVVRTIPLDPFFALIGEGYRIILAGARFGGAVAHALAVALLQRFDWELSEAAALGVKLSSSMTAPKVASYAFGAPVFTDWTTRTAMEQARLSQQLQTIWWQDDAFPHFAMLCSQIVCTVAHDAVLAAQREAHEREQAAAAAKATAAAAKTAGNGAVGSKSVKSMSVSSATASRASAPQSRSDSPPHARNMLHSVSAATLGTAALASPGIPGITGGSNASGPLPTDAVASCGDSPPGGMQQPLMMGAVLNSDALAVIQDWCSAVVQARQQAAQQAAGSGSAAALVCRPLDLQARLKAIVDAEEEAHAATRTRSLSKARLSVKIPSGVSKAGSVSGAASPAGLASPSAATSSPKPSVASMAGAASRKSVLLSSSASSSLRSSTAPGAAVALAAGAAGNGSGVKAGVCSGSTSRISRPMGAKGQEPGWKAALAALLDIAADVSPDIKEAQYAPVGCFWLLTSRNTAPGGAMPASAGQVLARSSSSSSCSGVTCTAEMSNNIASGSGVGPGSPPRSTLQPLTTLSSIQKHCLRVLSAQNPQVPSHWERPLCDYQRELMEVFAFTRFLGAGRSVTQKPIRAFGRV